MILKIDNHTKYSKAWYIPNPIICPLAPHPPHQSLFFLSSEPQDLRGIRHAWSCSHTCPKGTEITDWYVAPEKSVFQLSLCSITGTAPSKPLGLKKRKILESGPGETPSEEHGISSTLAPIPPMLALEATPFDSLLDGYVDHLAQSLQPEANRPSSAFAQNVATSGAWEVLLPKLVYPLMEQEQVRRGRNTGPSGPPTTTQCSCLQQNAKVLVVSFTSMYHQSNVVLMISM